MATIYLIKNIINNKIYIGQTIGSSEERFEKHFSYRNQKNRCTALYNAFNKYGKENFTVSTVVEGNFSKEELNKLEIFYIEHFKSLSPKGYNLQTGGGSYLVSEETKKRTSDTMVGRKILWADKISKTMKEKWKNSEYKKQMTIAHSKPYGKYKKHSKPLRLNLNIVEINKLYKSGKTITEIANKFGVSFGTIKKRITHEN
jgi:group I intron endonuclease